jgi:hypothetical protein
MRVLVLLFAVLMPLVAWMDNAGMFGPSNGEISDRYPTLLVAAGYAFSIWGLIFLLDLVYAVSQATGARRRDRALTLAAMPAAAGFLLTTAWMPMFSLGLFWACLAVIFGALACTAAAAIRVTRHGSAERERWARIALPMHAGWLALAAFLNLAQVIVANRLLPTDRMLAWSLPLLIAAGVTLWLLNRAMHGNFALLGAALWGLAAVAVKQWPAPLPGGQVMAVAALALAVLLVAQTVLLRRTAAHPRATAEAAAH